MANADAAPGAPPPPHGFQPLAAVLSYLVPGLGQIYQGRVAKGFLFLVCLYGLFFYGMYLGNWQNVYIPDSPPPRDAREKTRVLDTITDRARFFGQFWIGIAAWPAIVQHFSQPTAAEVAVGIPPVPPELFGEERLRAEQARQDRINAELRALLDQWRKGNPPHHFLGNFMRVPDEDAINKQLQNSDKKPDLGWMYTVIAGVLNILVIYDAFAGPAFGAAVPRPAPPPPEASEEKSAP